MTIFRKLRALFRKEKLDAEMTEEIRAHLELQTAENVKRGMSPDEARHAAQCEFGGVEQIKERARDQRGLVWLEQVIQDFRHAVRALNRHRGLTFVAVATLAFGLGVNTALFSVFNAVALRPLPLKRAEELVEVAGRNDIGWRISGFSYPDYVDLCAQQRAVPALAAWLEMTVPMAAEEVHAPAFVESRNSNGEVARMPLQFVSGNFFSVLGADIAFGRAFLPVENLHPGTHPVIVLQHQFWTQQFHGDPSVLGRTIKLRDTAFTVIGVAAPEFVGKTPAPPIGWVPAMMFDAMLGKASVLADRHATRFQVVARVPPGAEREQARAELEVLTRQLAQLYPDDHPKTRIEFTDTGTFMAMPINWRTFLAASPIWLSFALVLIMACANVANLLLARAISRQQEIGVRLAMGATRARILRHLLAESVLIALGGGLAGLLVTTWLLHAIRPPIFAMLPPVNRGIRDWLFVNLTPDYRVFGFTLALALVAALAAGLIPALQAARSDVNASLKNVGYAFTRPARMRHALIVIQIAVCLTLLTVSGLLVRHVLRLAAIETGLRTANVYSASISVLPTDVAQLTSVARRDAFDAAQAPSARREAFELARTLPGIKAIAQTYREPFGGRMRLTPIALEGSESAGAPQFAQFNLVSAEYFSVMGLAVTRGRVFTPQEVDRRLPVVVLSESTAQRFWPGEDPLGKRVQVSSVAFEGGWVDPRQARQQALGTFSSYEVIGVAPDTRSGWVWERDETMLYLPLLTDSLNARTTLVQFSGPRANSMSLAWSAAAARGVQLGLSVRDSLDEQRDLQLLPFKGVAAVGAGLGLLALLMAVVGLYGVMAFVVSQRVREIGIRVALGATAQAIVRLFVRQGMRLVAIGLALGGIGGMVASLALSKIVSGALPFDPVACAGVALLLAIVTVFACWLPSRRAAKVDPMVALRCE